MKPTPFTLPGVPPKNALKHKAALAMLADLDTMPVHEKMALLGDLEKLEQTEGVTKARDDFLAFCWHVYPGFKEGPHHRYLKPKLHAVQAGGLTRVTVSMPPRFGKSETVAYLFVAWYLGHNPTHHIMMVTHTQSLSADFGRKVRNLIDSPVYKEVFPNTAVSKDKSASDNWTTTVGGKYLAIGIGANVAGHGAHLLIADDLVSEQSVLSNPDAAFDTAWQYMQVGPLQRLMPQGKIIQIGTRWGVKDPIGRALQWAKNNPLSTQWDEIRFPAILPSGKSLWPDQWPLEELLAKKEGMFPQYWAAQYQQEPSNDEGAIIKREWWKKWEPEKAPKCEFIIMALDAAAEANNRADCTAITTWGVFRNEKDTQDAAHIILLDCVNERMEFPKLKDTAIKQYQQWEPDAFIVEKKSSGTALYQELRRIGIPVAEYTPHRYTGDKFARLNAVADVFRSGFVWYPAGRAWAEEVVDQVASFPFGDGDDIVDTTSMAMARFRNGGFLRLPTDEDDEKFRMRRRVAYY